MHLPQDMMNGAAILAVLADALPMLLLACQLPPWLPHTRNDSS